MEVKISDIKGDTDKIKPLSIVLFNDTILEIFNKLNIRDLGICRQVSKQWNKLASDPSLLKNVIYRDFAFNPMDWNRYFASGLINKFDAQKAFESLPLNIYAILESSSPLHQAKKIMDTHMLIWIPKTISGQVVSINNFAELLKQMEEFSDNELGYNYIWDTVAKKQGGSVAEHGWVLMTKDVLPNSRDFDFGAQQILVGNLNKNENQNWKVPKMAEAAICIYANNLKSGKFSFSNKPFTYTRCQENVKGGQVFIGAYDLKGIDIHNFNFYAHVNIGIAAVWRL